jgi:hypothetical protein
MFKNIFVREMKWSEFTYKKLKPVLFSFLVVCNVGWGSAPFNSDIGRTPVLLFYKGGTYYKTVLRYKDGSRYEGESANYWLRNECGKCDFGDGTIYYGDWKNDFMDGSGTAWYYNGDCYVGGWKNGEKHGTGTYYFSDYTLGKRVYTKLSGDFVYGRCGDIKDASEKGGKFDLMKCKMEVNCSLIREHAGKNILIDEFANLYFPIQQQDINGVFDGSPLSGTYQYTDADGYCFGGVWEDGQKVNGTLIFPNGDRYEGPLKDDLPNGSGEIEYADDERKYIGQFENGLPNGSGKIEYADGRKYIGQFENGLPKGSDGSYSPRGGFTNISENNMELLSPPPKN